MAGKNLREGRTLIQMANKFSIEEKARKWPKI